MASYTPPESLHVGTGVETVFGFNWPYLLPRDLVVTLNGQPVPTVLASANQVVISPAPALGVIIRIYRNTPAQNPTYLFASGIPMLPRYIDGNNKQLLYALQEGLLQFAQTQATAEEALIRAAAAEIAAKRAEEYAAQQARDIRRTVRVPTTDLEIPTLPSAADRANKVMGFDSLGNPVGTLPASGSGTELALDLANKSAPGKGAGQIGFRGKWLSDYISEQETHLTVEHFGPTDTPANTRVTMQTAIDHCAAAGVLLKAGAKRYVIDVSVESITLPSGFRCDFGGAWIHRATGNKTPHDMWVNRDMVNGNVGIEIRHVRFHGERLADALTNTVPAHRFCGLRLVKSEFILRDVRADYTVNGEGQVEGTRGGILMQDSVYADCEDLAADGTMGTGVFIDYGRGRLFGLRTRDNTGSGLSGAQSFWEMGDLSSVGSGYSGISLNGEGFRARGVFGSGAANGFAGVNIGHEGAGIRALNAAVFDVLAVDNASWGINVTGAPGLFGRGWRSRNNGIYNLRLTYAPNSDIEVESVGSSAGVVYRDSVGYHKLVLTGNQNMFTATTPGVEVVFGASSIIQGGTSERSGLQADPGCKITYSGTLRNNAGWGATANSGAISLKGATVVGNGVPWRMLSGGSILTRGVVLDEYAPTNGTFTIAALTASAVITNSNTITQSRTAIQPLNSEARALGIPAITQLTMGVGFTATASGASHTADAIYTYTLL